jgi:pantoate--beta-alanine ligase
LKSFRTIESLQSALSSLKNQGKTIGFVPTMGALHGGHLKLVEFAKRECDVVVVSIFVNPTQFNNSGDLTKYPKREEEDLGLLNESGCDIVVLPSVNDVYPEDYKKNTIPLGIIEKVMEGEFRPGHFQGVVNVVSRFFEIIQPDRAYFGNKDFQQVAVIKLMVKALKLPVEVIGVPTKRMANGLAMSSRNYRLSEKEVEESAIIYKTLIKGREWASKYSPAVTRQKMIDYFNQSPVKLEYLQIVHPETMEDLNQYWVPGAVCGIAAFSGEVRLIDNMKLIEEVEELHSH